MKFIPVRAFGTELTNITQPTLPNSELEDCDKYADVKMKEPIYS